MAVSGVPVTQDTAPTLSQIAVFTIAGYAYQGMVLCDSGTGLPISVEPSTRAKTFSAVTATTTAAAALVANTSRITAMIQNISATDCYLGKDNTLTTSNGILLAAGAALVDDDSTDAWWSRTASGTASLRIVEVA